MLVPLTYIPPPQRHNQSCRHPTYLLGSRRLLSIKTRVIGEHGYTGGFTPRMTASMAERSSVWPRQNVSNGLTSTASGQDRIGRLYTDTGSSVTAHQHACRRNEQSTRASIILDRMLTGVAIHSHDWVLHHLLQRHTGCQHTTTAVGCCKGRLSTRYVLV